MRLGLFLEMKSQISIKNVHERSIEMEYEK